MGDKRKTMNEGTLKSAGVPESLHEALCGRAFEQSPDRFLERTGEK